MEKCIFCKIIKGELDTNKVFEDQNFLSFLTIEPVNIGHILVIPKKHVVWMQEADDILIADIFKLSKKLMIALKKSTQCDFVEVLVVGEEIPHLHVHLIPRYLNDALPRFPIKKYKDGEAYEIVQKITEAL